MRSAPQGARSLHSIFFFFFNDTAPTEIYTLSLPDALPISLDLVAVKAAGIIGPGQIDLAGRSDVGCEFSRRADRRQDQGLDRGTARVGVGRGAAGVGGGDAGIGGCAGGRPRKQMDASFRVG